MQGQLGGVRVLAQLGGRLFGGLFRRADAISAAMTARGFAGAPVCLGSGRKPQFGQV